MSLFSKLGLFSGDYQNTNSLQHWPQLTTSNILDYIGDFPAYTGKFQAQLMPPIMEITFHSMHSKLSMNNIKLHMGALLRGYSK